MKLMHIIDSLPSYTQVGVLYQLIGSVNTSLIGAAQRKIAKDVRLLEAAGRASKTQFSIDKYNELLNELRQQELAHENSVRIGFEQPHNDDETIHQIDRERGTDHEVRVQAPTLDANARLMSNLMKLRAPLLAILNATQAKLPSRDQPADFSFEESLARQLAREYAVQEMADEAIQQAILDSGAATKEEIEAADRLRFDQDKAFKAEFKFLIIDTLRDVEADVGDSDFDEANAAFAALAEDHQHRLVKRMLPKLHEAKMQQLSRRSYDPDAATNVILLGLAINEMKQYVGTSEAEDKLAKLRAQLTS